MLKLNSRNFIKGKKGVSEVVAYVLLIVMAVSIAAMVFAWLRAQPKILEPGQECPEGTKVVLYGVSYTESSRSAQGNLTFEILNRGLFNIKGYTVRVNNREGEKIGAFILDKKTETIIPGNSSVYSKLWNEGNLQDYEGKYGIDEPLKYLTIQPWIIDPKTGKQVICKETSSAEL